MTQIDPSQPLSNARHERYSVLLASPEKRSAVECWVLSDPSPVKPDPTNGRAVASSRVANREDVKARVDYLRAQRAKQETEPEALNGERIATLMKHVTDQIMDAARIAESLGASDTGQKLRRAALTHAGRAERLHKAAPAVVKVDTAIDLDGALQRMRRHA